MRKLGRGGGEKRNEFTFIHFLIFDCERENISMTILEYILEYNANSNTNLLMYLSYKDRGGCKINLCEDLLSLLKFDLRKSCEIIIIRGEIKI